MITVRSLHVYPVKSCRGIAVDEAEVGATGFRYDRQWMVTDPEGVFLSQRSTPALSRISTRIGDRALVLEADGTAPLEIELADAPGAPRSATIWHDTCRAVSAGPAAARWLSSLLGTPCELVRLPQAEIRPVDPGHGEPGDRVAFADGYPFLLVAQASLDDLNRRLPTPVPVDRFRANLVVQGSEPYAEDLWSDIEIGDVALRVAKPCARCVVICTDQHDGSRSDEPLRTLAGYRKTREKIVFGQNLIHRNRGTIRVGDPVTTR